MSDQATTSRTLTSKPRQRTRGPSRRKHRQMLDAALALFLARGFAATSIDDVAREAGVSKQTVYAHFGDKPTLFAELITTQVGRTEAPGHPLARTLGETVDLESDLRDYARWHLALVMQPELVRLRRMLIGEAERFPELARLWFENGPERSCALFAQWFETLHERGLLETPDPMLAAQTFNWLVLSTPLNRAMAIPPDVHAVDPEELNRYADEGVRVFLAAYARQ